MSEPDWKWYAGNSDEVYCSGPFDTREEALDEGYPYILEAAKEDVSLSNFVDVDQLFENANDQGYDLQGESGEPLFDPSKEQGDDLNEMIRDAIDLWQLKHNLTFTPWCFTHQRNEEFIDGR